MFDFSYTNILHSNLINVIIVVSAFVLIFILLKVPYKISLMKDEVKEKIKKSKEETNASYQIMENALKKLENVQDDVNIILNEADTISKNLMAQAKKEADEVIKDINKNYEEKLKREILNCKDKISDKVCLNALNNARENVKNSLKNDSSLHFKYIEYAISSLDEVDF